MGRETSAAVRALLRCARQVSPEPPSARGLGAWPAAARGNPPCLARRGAHRGARSASRAWASALVQTTPQRPYARVDPDPAPSFALRGSAHVTARNASGRGRGGSDEPSRTTPAHRVNDQITARQVRLVIDREFDGASSSDTPDSNDTQQTKTHEVLSVLVALRRAKQLGLDLVEVNARADPPVCRLMRYDSFRYARKQKERDGRRAAVERRRADTVKELKLTARISPNDMRVKADKAQKFFASGHKVTLRVEFKTNDGVKHSLRPRAGELLFREFQSILIDAFDAPHVVVQEGKMVGPNHMTVTLAPESRKKGKTGKKGKTEKTEERPSEASFRVETRVEDREAVPAAEVAAQGDVVRALKARRGAGDDAVQQKDVDDAVAHLLRLKARLKGLKSPVEGAENPAAAAATDRTKTSENVRKRLSSVAAADARARGFASGSQSVFSRSFVSSARLGSRSAHGRAGERVGAAKARAKASRAAKNASKRSSDAPPTKSREALDEALDEKKALDEAGSVASDERFNAEDVEKFSNRDPSSFRLGAAAEEHVAYAREEARVAAVLAARREERAKAQARVDGEAEAEREGDESGTGAWAGAAAAATLAAAVAATLAATAASELTLVPRAFDDESRSESRSEPTTRVGQTRESKNDATSLKKKSKSARLHPALDAAVAFAGGAGVVVSALGWPPGR